MEARFDGGMVTTGAGARLVCEVCERQGFFTRLSRCFLDYHSPEVIQRSQLERQSPVCRDLTQPLNG